MGSPDDFVPPSEAEPSGRPATSKPPGLYLVATPIGNSRDITLRALDILSTADVIACEDTRVTAKLLAIHNIARPLLAYHEHNAEKAGADIIKRLKNGEIVALVSDVGTPMISDPGYRLVRACAEEDIYVTHLPGPSSVLTGLVLSGLPTDRFLFEVPRQMNRKLARLRAVGVVLQQDHPSLGPHRSQGHVEDRFQQRVRIGLGVQGADHVVERQQPAVLPAAAESPLLPQTREAGTSEKIVANGGVVNPAVLLRELAELREHGVGGHNLVVSDRATLCKQFAGFRQYPEWHLPEPDR